MKYEILFELGDEHTADMYGDADGLARQLEDTEYEVLRIPFGEQYLAKRVDD